MTNRLGEELESLRKQYGEVCHQEAEGHWFKITEYALPPECSLKASSIVFYVTQGHPGLPPYGFFAPLERFD